MMLYAELERGIYMNWQKYNWSILVICIVLTFAAACSSYFLWQNYVLAKPLTQAIEEIDGVETATLESHDKNKPSQEIQITLNQVKNLQASYQAINNKVTSIAGDKKYKIVLHDHRTPELEQLYYSIHYYIYEGIFTGKFSSMSEIIKEKSAAANTKALVYIDADYIYLHLTNTTGDLVQVIPRHPDSQEMK